MATDTIDAYDLSNSSGGINLQELLRQATGSNFTQKLTSVLQDKEASSAATAALTQAGVDSIVKAKQADLDSQIEEGKVHASYAKTLGTDVRDPNSQVNLVSQMLNESVTRMRGDIQNIEAKGNSTISKDGFWNFLGNRFSMAMDEGALKRHFKEASMLTDTLHGMNSTAHETNQTQDELVDVMTKDRAATILSNVATNAQIAAQQAKRQAYGDDADLLMKVNGASNEQLSQILEIQRAMALEDYRSENLATKTEKANSDAEYKQGVDAGRALVGLPPMPLSTYNAHKDLYQHFYEMGASAVASGNSKLGSTPGEVAVDAAQYKYNRQEPIFGVLHDSLGAVTSSMQANGEKLTPANVAARLNTFLGGPTGILTSMRNNMDAAEVTLPNGASFPNLMKVADIPTILTQNPAIGDTVFGREVLKPLLASPNAAARNSNFSQLADSAIAYALAHEINTDEMVPGMVQFYQTGLVQNNARQKFKEVGIEPPTQYRTNGINVTDQAALSRYLQKRALLSASTSFSLSKELGAIENYMGQ